MVDGHFSLNRPFDVSEHAFATTSFVQPVISLGKIASITVKRGMLLHTRKFLDS